MVGMEGGQAPYRSRDLCSASWSTPLVCSCRRDQPSLVLWVFAPRELRAPEFLPVCGAPEAELRSRASPVICDLRGSAPDSQIP